MITIDENKCLRDGICVEICPSKVIKVRGKNPYPSAVKRAEAFCINCGQCVAVCPRGALTHKNMKPEECLPVSREALPGFEQVNLLLSSRRSVRVYKDQPVSRAVLEKLIDLTGYASSGHNDHLVNWTIVENRNAVKELASMVADWMKLTLQEDSQIARSWGLDIFLTMWERGSDLILYDAPHAILIHSKEKQPIPGGSSLCRLDCIIAGAYLELAAYSMGLGTCWAGFLIWAAKSYPAIKQFLDIPEEHEVYGALITGYPKYKYHRIPLRKKPVINWK